MPTKEEKEGSLKKTSEKEEKIKKEAREILEKFAKALEKIKDIPDSFVERDEDRREEKEGKEPDKDFQKIFFENAPVTKKDSIQAEKGGWK